MAISINKPVWKEKQTYEIVRNRRKPYKTLQNFRNPFQFGHISYRICMVNFYGFSCFCTFLCSFVQFPTFTILTGKICYIHTKFTNRNKCVIKYIEGCTAERRIAAPSWRMSYLTGRLKNDGSRRADEECRISPDGLRTTHLAARTDNDGSRAYFFL